MLSLSLFSGMLLLSGMVLPSGREEEFSLVLQSQSKSSVDNTNTNSNFIFIKYTSKNLFLFFNVHYGNKFGIFFIFPFGVMRKGKIPIPKDKNGFAAFFVKGEPLAIFRIDFIFVVIFRRSGKSNLLGLYVVNLYLKIVKEENISVFENINIALAFAVINIINGIVSQIVHSVTVAPNKSISVINVL